MRFSPINIFINSSSYLLFLFEYFIMLDVTNVTNIIKQIKSLNFTGPAPNIDNIHIWMFVRYGHHDTIPALWWRFWASISVISYTYGQRSARVRTMNQTNYEMVSLPSHHLPTSSSNLSPDVMCTQLLVWCLVKPPWKSPSFHLAWVSTHVTNIHICNNYLFYIYKI